VRPPHHWPHILVVEDEAVVRDTVAEALRDEGYVVDTAANGLDALERLNEHRPDLVLLDLMMPIMDGRAFMRECQRDPRCIGMRVIVLSAAHRAADWATALGAHACVTKPFDLDELLEKINQVAAA
jgi:CheY-like chemotaxis protein